MTTKRSSIRMVNQESTDAPVECERHWFILTSWNGICLVGFVICLLMSSQSGASGIYQQQLAKQLENNITNPYVDGVVASFAWSVIEPREGEYQWNVIEEAIRPWIEARKKVILGVYSGSVGTIGERITQATPEWVFTAGATKMRVPDGTILPIYWDPIYLQKYGNFAKAFGKRYDGDPRIEFIRVGVGVWGEVVLERWFTRPESANMRGRWMQQGYTPERWLETIEKVMAIYREAFAKTPCAIMLAGIYGDRNGISKIAERAVSFGFYLEQNGLRADWKQYTNTAGISRIFQKNEGRTKLILEAWGNTQRSETFQTGEVVTQGTLMDTVKVGIDYGADYLLLYPPDIAKGDKRNAKMYNSSYEEALKYATEKLRMKASR